MRAATAPTRARADRSTEVVEGLPSAGSDRAILSRMVVRLDPQYPLLWRTPDSLQFGVASPPVVLETVSSSDEKMIAALVDGISESGLAMIGHDAGASDEDVATFLERVRPALLAPSPAPRRVLVTGVGHTAAAISRAIAARGHILVADRPDLVVVTAHFVVPPALHGMWLRRDIPHLPVVVLDTAVEIGPLVEPGRGPCLLCLLAEETDADAAWPALAAQLLGSRSAADTPETAGEVAATVSRLVARRLASGAIDRHESLTIDLRSGTVTARPRVRRDDCGCAEVRGRRENDSPADDPDVTRLRPRSRPTRGSVVGALG